MKFIPFALILLAALAGGYVATSRALRAPESANTDQQLEWLTREFSLEPEAAAEVRRIQTEYGPICAKHCAAIAKAETALLAATAPEDRVFAERELERLRKVCADATLAHLRSVAARMPRSEGERFLRMMEPRVAHQTGRTGAPDLSPGGEP
ncbi:MAG: hypothetical protein RLZZ50_1593 [Verrucomicrobiota bacterium]|jgi:hypothetical protein